MLKNVTKDFINNTGIFMQIGFEGNKTELIEKEAQRKLDRLQFIRIDDMIEACKKAKNQKMLRSDSRLNGKDFDAYRHDVAMCYLRKIIERANEEGLG